jgi:hypothetical protein
MSRLNHLIGKALHLLRDFEIREVWEKSKRRIYSDSLSFGLKRDIAIPFEAPAAKIPIEVRPLEEKDIPSLLNVDSPDISDEERKELVERRSFLEKGMQTCYVAVDVTGSPCYMQWLIGSSGNELLAKEYNGGFPRLAPDEALLENAFTPEKHRGYGIMPTAMARIAYKAKDINARYVITFVHHENIPSLKGCKRAGFSPYVLRRDRWFLFRRQLTFVPLPPGTPYPFDKNVPKEEPALSIHGSPKRRLSFIATPFRTGVSKEHHYH